MDEKPTGDAGPVPPGAGDDEVMVAKLDLTVAGQPMHVEIPISTGLVSGAALIPIARALGAAIAERVIAVEAAAERHVSCRKGCGACCRQVVPISISEARAIHALVEAMPEPRRSEIRARFAAIRDALTAAGLHETILDPTQIPEDGARALSFRYFKLGLACPFLEDESCSIHADRPVACREYLVTSPAELCADPAAEKINGVPRPMRVDTALIRCDPEAPPERATWVALSTALDWVAQHPSPEARMLGPDLLRFFLTLAFRRNIPTPGEAPGSGGMVDVVR
jgi:Fe-S-cluster containining protein